MKPDPKRIVERGYDSIGPEYERWSGESVSDPARERYTRLMLDSLPEGAAVLDLGCGSGALLTRRLSERFAVTGIDLSKRMIELAKRNVQNAKFVRADMAAADLPADSFDGVCAFYSLTHLPPEELPAVLRSISNWLKPGGLFVGSMGTGENPGAVESDWLAGVPMYFAGHAAGKNEELLGEAGLRVTRLQPETHQEAGSPVSFTWVVASRP